MHIIHELRLCTTGDAPRATLAEVRARLERGIAMVLVAVAGGCIAADTSGPTPGTDSPFVSDLLPMTYDTARVSVGDRYYVDRTFVVTALGPGLKDHVWIRTVADDWDVTAESHLSFTLSAEAIVVVGYDAGATALPDWLDDWMQAPVRVQVSVPIPPSPLRIFYKLHQAGPVSLGGNLGGGAEGAQAMYVVMLLRPGDLGPAAIAVTPSDVVLDPLQAIRFGAVIEDALGRTIAGAGSVGWAATGGSIDAGGLFTAGNTPGQYEVTASLAGGAVTRVVPVTIREPASGDLTAPIIANGQPTGSLPHGTTQASMSVNTDETATCRWGTTSGTPYADLPNAFTSTGGTTHSTLLTGLVDGQHYTRYVRCRDAHGNANASSYAISFDVASPPPGSPRTLTRDNGVFALDGVPISHFGLRVANALQSGEIAARFEDRLPDILAHGMQSFSLTIQGGRNTDGGNSGFNGFNADGTLKAEIRSRLTSILDASERLGMVPVVVLFYRGRDEELANADAVRRAVRETLTFLRPWRHAWVHLINEPGHSGYDRDILRTAAGQRELYALAKSIDPGRIVYVSHESGANDGFLSDSWSRNGVGASMPTGSVSIEYLRHDEYGAPGVFSETNRDLALADLEAAFAKRTYFFWHAAWHQKADAPGWPRFDKGGSGTSADPGVAWIWDRISGLAGQP